MHPVSRPAASCQHAVLTVHLVKNERLLFDRTCSFKNDMFIYWDPISFLDVIYLRLFPECHAIHVCMSYVLLKLT